MQVEYDGWRQTSSSVVGLKRAQLTSFLRENHFAVRYSWRSSLLFIFQRFNVFSELLNILNVSFYFDTMTKGDAMLLCEY